MNRSLGRAAGVAAAVSIAVPVTLTASPGPAAADAGEASAPGAVVTVQELPPELVLTRASSGYLFEYATTGPEGEPATSLGTLYLPEGEAPAEGWPVLSYGHGTMGLSDTVLSYPLWVGEGNTGDAYLSQWLDAGFAVAASEYVGIGTPGVHPYLNVRSEGAAMIDVVRAARAVVPSLSPVWYANGYSQGGHASLAAAWMAHEYAPELTLAGISAGGVPAGVADELALVTPLLQYDPGTGLTVYFAYVLAGFRAANPDYPLDRYLSARGREVLALAEELDFFALAEATNGLGPGALVSRPLATGDLLPAVRDHLGLPTSGYGVPLQIYQQSLDIVSPAVFTTRLVAGLKLSGEQVDYRVYHSAEGHAAWDEALPDVIATAVVRVAEARA